MSIRYQVQFPRAAFILDPEDAYARELGVRGHHPRPIGPLKYSLVGTVVAGVRQNFEQPLDLVTSRNASGYDLFFGNIRTAQKELRRVELADATYVLRFESDGTGFYQRGERIDLTLPQPRTQSFHLDLFPGYAYPFPGNGTFPAGRGPAVIQGGLFDAEGAGIAGATASLNPTPFITVSPGVTRPWLYSQAAIDEGGQFTLVVPLATDYPGMQPGLPAAGTTVTVRYLLPAVPPNPAPPPVNLANIPFAPGQPTSLNQAALRGSVRRAAGGPISGAVITVTGEPASSRTASDGTWVHYFGLTQANAMVTVTARLPDGSVQAQNNIPVRARQTVWVPAFAF